MLYELLWEVEPHAIPKRRAARVAGLSPPPLAPAFGVADGRLGGEGLRPLHRRSCIVVVQGERTLAAQFVDVSRAAAALRLRVAKGACR